jgi:hypothetical protein
MDAVATVSVTVTNTGDVEGPPPSGPARLSPARARTGLRTGVPARARTQARTRRCAHNAQRRGLLHALHCTLWLIRLTQGTRLSSSLPTSLRALPGTPTYPSTGSW